ncbi:MAG: TRAP transporter permease, partial [Chloroflexi bacterium]|nr:TRAP transporter permease [Chloroflexota bacterium]
MTSGRVSLTIVLETVAGLLAVFNLLVASQALTLLNFFMPAPQHRAANLLLVLILVFCLHSRHGGEQKRSVPWYDWLIMAVGVVGAGFVVFNYETVINYSSYGYLDTTGIILALMLMVAVLEAVRRFTGWVLPLVIVAFVLMTIFQQYLPGLLNGKGYSLDRLLFSVYASGSGIFGVPLGVSSAILT